MPISKEVFQEYFMGLCDRYNRVFKSPITAKGYYTYLSVKMTDEEFATAVMAWITDKDMFPTPAELLAHWKGTQPPKSAAIEVQGKLYHELTEEERKQADAARERIWEMLKSNSQDYIQSKAGFTSIGGMVSEMFQLNRSTSAPPSLLPPVQPPSVIEEDNQDSELVAVGEF